MINKIITLKNGKEYVIADKCVYKGNIYYFACEILNGEATENFKILQICEKEDKKIVKFVENDEIIKKVCDMLDK
ncbi:MAG: hypothetical protein ACI31R_00970 [Bacilli bacterium]